MAFLSTLIWINLFMITVVMSPRPALALAEGPEAVAADPQETQPVPQWLTDRMKHLSERLEHLPEPPDMKDKRIRMSRVGTSSSQRSVLLGDNENDS